jgi:hypothetical protein
MRNILLLLCVFGMSYASLAQSDNASWTNLNTLHSGQKIQIVEKSSKKHSGTFLNVSDTGVQYHDNAGDQSIPKQDVRRVKLMESRRRLRNTLIGAGIGAGAGAGIGAGSWEDRGFVGGKGVGAAVGASIGVLTGAAIGALVPTHSTIYSVNAN